jgi:3-isopropylmalate/(R)-2-methylmalate dehydratase small subunit
MPASRVQAMIRGDDEISITLQHQEDIADFYQMKSSENPWLFPQDLIGQKR